MRYRAQIKQRKSDETRESNREAPHLKPCDLEAESCKINHLTISELKDDLLTEQRRDIQQFRDTSLIKGYVSSIDEFFMRGCNLLIVEESYIDSSVVNHILTGIRVENGVITETCFYS